MNELQKVYTITKIKDYSDTINNLQKKSNTLTFMAGVMSLTTLTAVGCYFGGYMDEKAVYISMLTGYGTALFNHFAKKYDDKINKENQQKESLEVLLKLDELGGNTKVKK